MTLTLYRRDSGNLISKVAESKGQEAQLRAEGFRTPAELWPGPADPAEPAMRTCPAEASDAPAADEETSATPIDGPRKRKGKP